MEHHFWQFIWAVFDNWAGFATGGIIVAVVWLWLGLRQKTMTRKGLFILSLCFLIMAVYKAWEDQYEQAEKSNENSDAFRGIASNYQVRFDRLTDLRLMSHASNETSGIEIAASNLSGIGVLSGNLVLAGSQTKIGETVADKGYHDNGWLADLRAQGIRSYIPERRQKTHRWTNKPAAYERAFRANRRRVRGNKGRQLNRWRSERCERTFAHTCETGGGRRSWLRGQSNVSKAHTLRCAAYNLGLLLRKVWGLSKPRSAKRAVAGWFLAISAMAVLAAIITGVISRALGWLLWPCVLFLITVMVFRCGRLIHSFWKNRHFLTGC